LQSTRENTLALDRRDDYLRGKVSKRQMIFRLKEKEFSGTTAVNIVRALERDDKEYRHCGGSLRQYLSWSLNQPGSRVSSRDLDVSDRLEDEALALDYLLLLDEYGMGELIGPLKCT